jgi:predicted adenylyl cyclase CyaB
MLEVELRSFITEQQYDDLFHRFLVQGQLVEHSRQITHYIDHKIDTRIQLSTFGGKVWQKLGNMHDLARKEREVMMSRLDAQTMLEIFQGLGFKIKVSWYRERQIFKLGEIAASLDNTIGYGRILEVEIRCNEHEVNEKQNSLLTFLKEIDIHPSSKAVFDKAFAEYIEHWLNRTQGLNESWLDEAYQYVRC